jgi:hypothetical protein
MARITFRNVLTVLLMVILVIGARLPVGWIIGESSSSSFEFYISIMSNQDITITYLGINEGTSYTSWFSLNGIQYLFAGIFLNIFPIFYLIMYTIFLIEKKSNKISIFISAVSQIVSLGYMFFNFQLPIMISSDRYISITPLANAGIAGSGQAFGYASIIAVMIFLLTFWEYRHLESVNSMERIVVNESKNNFLQKFFNISTFSLGIGLIVVIFIQSVGLLDFYYLKTEVMELYSWGVINSGEISCNLGILNFSSLIENNMFIGLFSAGLLLCNASMPVLEYKKVMKFYKLSVFLITMAIIQQIFVIIFYGIQSTLTIGSMFYILIAFNTLIVFRYYSLFRKKEKK